MGNRNGPYLLGNGVHLAGFQFFLVRNHTTCVLLHYAEKEKYKIINLKYIVSSILQVNK